MNKTSVLQTDLKPFISLVNGQWLTVSWKKEGGGRKQERERERESGRRSEREMLNARVYSQCR